MKKIRFIKRIGYYDNVENSMINPIIAHLPSDSYLIEISRFNQLTGIWEYDKKNSNDYFNVSFFIEGKNNFYDFLISHGIADKSWRNETFVQNFNYVGVSGQAWVDKYHRQGMNKDRIKLIGYPKLDKLYEKRKEFMIENQKTKQVKIKVLYAPTHNMNPNNLKAVSSYPRLLPFLKNLPKDIELITSLHPANNGTKITYDELINADVVIADSGSTLYEAWALDIPVIFTDWLVRGNILDSYPRTFEEYIYTKRIGYHAKDERHLINFIYIANKNGLDNTTINFMETILPMELRGRSGKTTANTLLELANQ